MKICITNSFYPPYTGGAERYVSSLARKLAEFGDEVTVYCASIPLHAGESYDGKVRVVRMRTPLMLYGTPITLPSHELFKEDFDIIHANFPSPYLAYLSSMISRVRGIPSVITWHNDLPAVTSTAGLLVKAHNLFALSYLRDFKRIIATTKSYATKSRILGKFQDRVVVIPNGVDTKRFNPEVGGERIREKYKLNGKKVIIFVGAMTPWHRYKGFDVLLRAFAKAKKKFDSLVLLAVGSGSLLGYYQRLANELKISSSVIFAGYVSDDELPEYYAASDFLVLPSLDSSEGFGIVLLEAMASGKPVIASRVGGIVDVVRDGENGFLVEPRDEDALALKLIELANSRLDATNLGRSCRIFAEDYDWGRIARSTKEVYSSALS